LASLGKAYSSNPNISTLLLQEATNSGKFNPITPKSTLRKFSGVDEPEQSRTSFRYLLFSRNARSGTYCQISRNAFYLPFRHLFTMGGDDDDDYEFITASSRKLHNSRCTLHSDVINIWRQNKFVLLQLIIAMLP